MKRGEVWTASLDPIKGREQSGIRPVVIISGNDINDFTDLVIICPFTTALKPIKKCHVIKSTKSNGLTTISQVLPFQIRAISKERLLSKLGSLEDETTDLIIKDLNYFLLK